MRAVLVLLESGGYDAVQLRAVARRARVSLATIYRLFPTRDELIVATVEQWMAANVYSQLAPPPAGESLYDGLMRVFRHRVQPWNIPVDARGHHRAAAATPAGARLTRQGAKAIVPAARHLLDDRDPEYAADVADSTRWPTP